MNVLAELGQVTEANHYYWWWWYWEFGENFEENQSSVPNAPGQKSETHGACLPVFVFFYLLFYLILARFFLFIDFFLLATDGW